MIIYDVVHELFRIACSGDPSRAQTHFLAVLLHLHWRRWTHTSLPNSLHSVTFRRRLGRQHFYYGPSWASWCGRAAHHHPLWTGPRWTRWWHYKDTVVLRLWFKTDSCRSEQKHICSTPLYKPYWSPQPRFLPPDCHGNFRRRDRTVDNIVVEHTCQHTSPSQWLYLSLRSLCWGFLLIRRFLSIGSYQ